MPKSVDVKAKGGDYDVIIVTEAAKRGFRALWLEVLAEERDDQRELGCYSVGLVLDRPRRTSRLGRCLLRHIRCPPVDSRFP